MRSYYGSLEKVKIPKNRSWSQMAADDVIKKVLEKTTEKLLHQNNNNWLHFERRFMAEFNKLRAEIKEMKDKADKVKVVKKEDIL